MKKIALLLLLCITACISCKKDNDSPEKVSVIGSWHLFSIIYSLAEHTPSDNVVLTFDAAGEYTETTNGETTAQGSYSTKYNNIDSINQTTIIYNPALYNAPAAQAERFNDTLILIPEVVSTDGYELKYKKQ